MKTLLLVDDDPNIHLLLDNTLAGNPNYRVLHAHDGEEGLVLADQEKPDLVLLDVFMPRMDGFAVCQSLKSNPATRDVVVILLTAADHKSVLKHRECAPDGYFPKPFSPRWLLMELNEILEVR